ncbi:MAG: zf-HC2 domain-containing protein [Streptosporangiales bacterium]|nr:zf-HC2 domain-containing protein [Streptosporangiales bacterium]MBO0890527.1 zf-HC2 domain-containing protein [Acidothermales bacterium]
MAAHVDTDTLADHAEGVLDPERDARVRGHLSSCAQCRDVVDQLHGVSTMLASLPPPSIPDDVSARIEASIAQLQHERAGYVPGARSAVSAPKRSWFTNLFAGRPQLLAGAAVLIVGLIFTGGYLATALNSNDNTPGATQTGLPTGKASVPMITGRAYRSGTLAAQARALVADRQKADYTPNPAASRALGGEVRRLQDRNALAGCVTAVTNGRPDRIVAVDLGQYNGKPAAIVVMTTPAADDRYQVAVVGPGCSAANPQIITRTTIAKS